KKNFDGVEKSIFKAAENVNLDSILGWEKDGIKTKYLEVYDEE
ncbi:tRNA 2-thiocytidine biosynthesis protein TtcA, partial [Clostridium tertium]|nr:tRNA 2-thiocytidine biosynthesis protein TtcA [Clostridium tertium]